MISSGHCVSTLGCGGCGDINNDGTIDLIDLGAAIDIMNGVEPYPASWKCIDMNSDGSLTDADVNILIDIQLGRKNVGDYCCVADPNPCGTGIGTCCPTGSLNAPLYCDTSSGSGYCCPTGQYFDAGICVDAEECGIGIHETASFYCPYRPFNDPAGEQSSWWSDDPWCIIPSTPEACCYNSIRYGEPDYYDWTPITTY